MPANDYHFVTRWRFLGTATEVSDILSRPEDYPRWWPSVYLAAALIEPGNGNGVGRKVALLTKGWLPYTLSWDLQVTGSRLPHVIEFEAEGDFLGGGRWEIEPAGAWVNVTLDWRVLAEKPLIALLSPVLRPVFGANHRWAMRRGEESLMLELARKRAATPDDRARVPPPPRATTSSALPAIAAAVAVLLLAGVVLGGASRRRRSRRR